MRSALTGQPPDRRILRPPFESDRLGPRRRKMGTWPAAGRLVLASLAIGFAIDRVALWRIGFARGPGQPSDSVRRDWLVEQLRSVARTLWHSWLSPGRIAKAAWPNWLSASIGIALGSFDRPGLAILHPRVSFGVPRAIFLVRCFSAAFPYRALLPPCPTGWQPARVVVPYPWFDESADRALRIGWIGLRSIGLAFACPL